MRVTFYDEPYWIDFLWRALSTYPLVQMKIKESRPQTIKATLSIVYQCADLTGDGLYGQPHPNGRSMNRRRDQRSSRNPRDSREGRRRDRDFGDRTRSTFDRSKTPYPNRGQNNRSENRRRPDNRQSSSRDRDSRFRQNGRFDKNCFECGKPGHLARLSQPQR